MYYLANFSHKARSIESYNYQFGPYPKRVTCATCQVYSIFIFLQDTFFKMSEFHLHYRPPSDEIGPTQVKCRLLISSIFYVMNFQHFFGNAEI